MRRRSGRSGVTLLEMLVVMAILSLVVGLVFPGVSTGLDSLRLRTSSDSVAALLTQAMTRVDRTEEAVEIGVEPAQGLVWARGARPGFVNEFRLPPGFTLAVPGVEGNFRAVLLPGGTFPALRVVVASPKGIRRLIRIDPLTSAALVETRLDAGEAPPGE